MLLEDDNTMFKFWKKSEFSLSQVEKEAICYHLKTFNRAVAPFKEEEVEFCRRCADGQVINPSSQLPCG